MLIQRLLTAIVLIPLVIAALFFLPLQGFVIVMILLCGLAAWEWSQFLLIKSKKYKILFTLFFTALTAVVYYLPSFVNQQGMIFGFILIVSLWWWLVALLLVISYPNSVRFWQNSSVVRLLFSIFTIIPFFVGMIELRQINYHVDSYQGAFWLLYVLVLVWATDSGAYFAGRAWGKHKLAPHVSPGKTIEGLIGGVFVSLLITLFVYLSHFFNITFYNLVMSSVLAILASILGDLTESMFKREANIKDSGHLIPGHGGILDRIDSLTAAIPVFAAVSIYLL